MAEGIAMSGFRVIFAGGGTGGHLMPGLSVAEELRRRLPPGSRVAFVCAGTALEKRMVEGRGFEFLALPSLKRSGYSPPRHEGTKNGLLGISLERFSWCLGVLVAEIEWAARAAGGLLAARRLIRRLRPDLIVSLGGHAAVAPSLAAALCGVPVAIMEQNALPGKANRLLSWWAREVYAPWPGTEPFFARPGRVRVTGNPVRADLLRPRTRPAWEGFGLDRRKKTLLVMGGSQGAQFINLAVLAALPALEAESSWLQVLHSAGEGGYPAVAAAYAGKKIQSAVFPFIEDMASAYAVSDLALCRAGGTTLAELTALGVPAVLVPLPTAANDHQRRNASLVAGTGAALILEQADIFATKSPRHQEKHCNLFPESESLVSSCLGGVSEGRLAAVLTGLLRNEECLARMRAASLRLGRPDAARNVADRIIGLLSVPPRVPGRAEDCRAAAGAVAASAE